LRQGSTGAGSSHATLAPAARLLLLACCNPLARQFCRAQTKAETNTRTGNFNSAAMGGFKNAVPAAAGVATTYYSTKKGANFGGYCSNASCPSQALVGTKQVSFCAGMVRAARRFC